MAEKVLPRQMKDLLKAGDIPELKKVFSECDPNAIADKMYCSNIFSLAPMPREFAFWAKEQGADVNFRDPYGETPIFLIIRKDADVKLLIDLGAEIEAVRPDGWTPLHMAVSRGRTKAARALLKAGANIDAQTNDYNGYGHFTPLETVLYTSDPGCTKKYEICKLLLDRGAKMTDRSRQFVSALSETFHRHTSGKKTSKFLQNQADAIEKLCKLFDAEMLPAASFHDGVSPIILTTVGGFKDNFEELWDFLVPPRGRAQVAQGEVIRIAGRVKDELLRNGGLNWDEDYQKMLRAFREYLRLGNPADSDEYIKEITDALMDGDVNDGMLWRLRCCALYWVKANPDVIPLLDTDYTR